jgi:hypothetical protein
MVFAIEPEDLERFAIPIAVVIAAIVVLAIPPVRRSLLECFRAGQRHGRKLSGEEDADQNTDGRGER